MNKIKITVADRFWNEAMLWLKSHSGFDVCEDSTEERLAETEGLIVRTKFILNEAALEKMPKLKAIVTATAGFDHINLEACEARGIKVAHAPNAHSASTAEMTFALVLACARKMRSAEKLARSLGTWNRDSVLGTQLAGKTYGVIGLGRVGSLVARMARGFGMTVVAHDPYRNDEWFKQHEAQRVGFDELFNLSQVISIHAPLTDETRNRVHRLSLEMLQPTSILVNTARGEIIREQDLIEHLRQKRHGFFGLDVFPTEPLAKGHGLLEDFKDQVVLTPHIGANTDEAFQGVSMEAARSLVALLEGAAAPSPLPPPAEWYRSRL